MIYPSAHILGVWVDCTYDGRDLLAEQSCLIELQQVLGILAAKALSLEERGS